MADPKDTYRDKNRVRWTIIAGTGGQFGTPDPTSEPFYAVGAQVPDTGLFNNRKAVENDIDRIAKSFAQSVEVSVKESAPTAGPSGWIILAVVALLVLSDSKR